MAARNNPAGAAAGAGGQPPQAGGAQAQPAWLVAANGLGLSPDELELYELMVNDLHFTHDQYVCLKTLGGYSTLRDLDQWGYKDIKDWCHNMARVTLNRGGRTFGDLKIKQLQAISWYVTDTLLRGQVIDVNEFRAQPGEYRMRAEFDYNNSQDKTVTVDKPAKFEYKKWIGWEESVYRYFDSIKNTRGVPLSYVIRKDLPAGTDIASLNRHDQLIYTAQITGFFFNLDSEKVLSIIKESLLDTEAESWIRNIKCGREAMKALQGHYDGPAEARNRITTANQQLEKLFYRHEFTFSFEKYVTALNGVFKTLERYDEPMYESNKVKALLDKCQNNNQEFKQSVQMCRTLHNTFEDAVTYLKTEVGRIFPDIKGIGGKKRTISNVNKSGAKGKSNKVNGVDISDLSRWYSDEEFKRLPRWAQKKIATHTAHMNKHADKRQKKRSARKTSAVETKQDETPTAEDNQQNRLVAAVINGVHNASRHSSTPPSVQFPANGSRATQISAANRRQQAQPDENSQVTFDHLGNPM